MTIGIETPKARLLQQFIEGRPLGRNIQEDLEDVESELTLMELEGIDLTNVTVREVLKRMGVY